MTKSNRFGLSSFGFRTKVEVTAPLEGAVEHAILALGHLVLIGWLPTDSRPQTVSLKASNVSAEAVRGASFVRHVREDVSEQFRRSGRDAPFQAGFVCALPLGGHARDAVRKDLVSRSEISVDIALELGAERRFAIVPVGFADAMRAGLITKQRMQMLLQSLSAAPSSSAILEFLRSVGTPSAIKAHIEVALTTDRKRMLLAGWAEDAGQSGLLLVGADLTEPPQSLDAVHIPRNDVTAHLRAMGSDPTSNLHGFVTVADVCDQKAYRLCRLAPNPSWSDELVIEPKTAPTGDVLAGARQLARESTHGTAEGFRRLGRTLIGGDAPPEPKVAHVHTYGPTERASRPRTSIIIPFYGDAFYLVDHLVAQKRAPEDVEWIIVCDDPRLNVQMTAAVSNRQSLIHQPTRLVLLESNGGFAHANNVGAQHASGQYLLLMNSDIYCAGFQFIDHAIALLEKRPDIGCAGFSLQFEDGTIQHDGMKFERAQWLDGLWACEHVNKGMPQDWNGFSDTSADAVTAALLLLRKADFEGQILDPAYIVGDFEDADLCMRLRDGGKTIALVRAGGLYHLERQSMRHAGDLESRRAFTHLNSLTFNDRWAHKLNAAPPRAAT